MENNKKRFFKNFLYVFSSNGIGMIMSFLITFILPVIFKEDIASYGYVQLYMLYVSYYFLFNFGLCSGVFLKEGGKNYQDLNKNSYSSQFIYLIISITILVSFLFFYIFVVESDISKKFIYFFVGINTIILQPQELATSILQSTNRIKEYSKVIVSGKFVSVILIIASLLLKLKDYRVIIIILTIANLFSLSKALWSCRDIIVSRPLYWDYVKDDIKSNMSSGIKLLLSDVSSMLIIGIVRLAIEKQWSIEIFAKVSFSISLINLFMPFISAVSVVLYPEMRRMDSSKHVSMYYRMRTIMMTILLGALAFYYPIRILISGLLPKYADSMLYMAILFPICIYSSKMSMLIQTYMKVLRMEKKLLAVNTITLILSCTLTVLFVFRIKNIVLSISLILVCHMFRTIIAEVMLSKEICINIKSDILLEVSLTLLYIVSNWVIGDVLGMIIYIAGYVLYLFNKRSDIKLYFPNLKVKNA